MAKKRLAKWFAAANKRRGELIYKDSLTTDEAAELEALQERCLDEVNRVYPGPPIDVRLDAILKKYGEKSCSS